MAKQRTFIISEHQLKLLRQILIENSMPTITIEINEDENNYFNAIQNARTNREKNGIIRNLQQYYKEYCRQNYTNKSAINKSSGVNVDFVMSGIDHSLWKIQNYYLWPAIRYLPSIIEISSCNTEISQHINNPNTDRGDQAYIFNCSGEYIFRTGKETHELRISAITYKNRPNINIRHVGPNLNENQNIIKAKLVSFEIL